MEVYMKLMDGTETAVELPADGTVSDLFDVAGASCGLGKGSFEVTISCTGESIEACNGDVMLCNIGLEDGEAVTIHPSRRCVAAQSLRRCGLDIKPHLLKAVRSVFQGGITSIAPDTLFTLMLDSELLKGSPLCALACSAAAFSRVPDLLSAGFSPTQPGGEGVTPLIYAVRQNDMDACDLLCRSGADVTEDCDPHNGMSVLSYAASYLNEAAVRRVLRGIEARQASGGAPKCGLNHRDASGLTPLLRVALALREFEAMSDPGGCQAHDATETSSDDPYDTPARQNTSSNHAGGGERHRGGGYDSDDTSSDESYGGYGGRGGAVAAAVHSDTDSDSDSGGGGVAPAAGGAVGGGVDNPYTLQFFSWKAEGMAQKRRVEAACVIAEMLIDAGAEVDATTSDNETALCICALESECDLASLLVRHGANVNHESTRGQTALTSALALNNGALTLLLESHGAVTPFQFNGA